LRGACVARHARRPSSPRREPGCEGSHVDDPTVTVELLKLNTVVSVQGFFDGDRLTSVGIT
jgi:hypothetical protein